jgi:hypothetical protein
MEDMGGVTLAVLRKRTEMQAEKAEKEKKGLIYDWQLERLGLGQAPKPMIETGFTNLWGNDAYSGWGGCTLGGPRSSYQFDGCRF